MRQVHSVRLRLIKLTILAMTRIFQYFVLEYKGKQQNSLKLCNMLSLVVGKNFSITVEGDEGVIKTFKHQTPLN